MCAVSRTEPNCKTCRYSRSLLKAPEVCVSTGSWWQKDVVQGTGGHVGGEAVYLQGPFQLPIRLLGYPLVAPFIASYHLHSTIFERLRKARDAPVRCSKIQCMRALMLFQFIDSESRNLGTQHGPDYL